MNFLRVGIALLFVGLQLLVAVPPVGAVSPNGLVISHVIAGETGLTNAEFVGVYNNSASDIDMTGYCLWSSSYVSGAIACITAEANTKVFIKSHGYLTFSSSTFAANHTYTPDTAYPAANRITVGGDSVFIKDTVQNEIDRVTWGSGGLVTGGTLQRKETVVGSGALLDTDAPADFMAITTLLYPANMSYDVVTIVDVCPNIDGVQQAVPQNHLYDSQGNCQPDSCLNIPGLQVSVPGGYDADNAGNCIEHDECNNLTGVQTAVPPNMVQEGTDCLWDLLPIELTELLPNAAGSDTGNEFIEVYNPNSVTIDLTLYSVVIGANAEKSIAFPVGTTIAPGEYRAFGDQTLKFVLVNSMGRAALVGINGTTYGDSGTYENPPDGQSWALIGGGWQYTNSPTPGAPNAASAVEPEQPEDSNSSPAPCPAGKYRNPLTNRCRTIVSDAAVLSTCDEGQYRNPETGRCRKITTTTVTPCKEGQYRSEETNRCRNIVVASTQKPCKDNQYRSEETGRCRNLTATSVPESAFAVQPVKDGAMAFVGWWALGGVGLLALAYAGWEWRMELFAAYGRAASFFSGKR